VRAGGRLLRLVAIAAAASIAACSPDAGTTTADRVPEADVPVEAGQIARVDLPALVQELEPSVVTVLVPGGAQGSGVVYREDGIIVTNQHVVGDAEQVVIAFADGQRAPAEVLATDALVDVAVVRVERDDLPVPDYRTDLPEVGELAVVIGSPLGFFGSVTAGIISGLGREIPGSAAAGQQALVDLIQTDAPISPGNSGGALVDAEGRVIGLSEAYIPPAAGAVALGFAIPAETVVRVADQLLEDGRAEHAYLGVQFGRLTPQIAEQLDVDREGALVLGVPEGGPAATAGLQPGDVVVEVASERVRTTEDVLSALRSASPGDRLVLTVLREGQEREIAIVVGDRPS
jgi:serine protease DegQ